MREVRPSLREDRKRRRLREEEVPEMRRESRPHDRRAGHSIQRFGLVRDRLRGKKRVSGGGRKRRRIERREIQRENFGFEERYREDRDQDRCRIRQLEQRFGESQEKVAATASASSGSRAGPAPASHPSNRNSHWRSGSQVCRRRRALFRRKYRPAFF